MRCPYCGGLNQERAAFCVSCGRDLTRGAYPPVRPGTTPQGRPASTPNQPVYRAPNAQQTYAPAPARPTNQIVPARPANQPAQPQQAQTAASRRQTATRVVPAPAPLPPVSPAPEPDPPVSFPPRTMEQFKLLLTTGAQPYTVVESTMGNGRRKLVRVAYARCAGWQQAATLLKALQEQQDEKCSAIIIQGVLPQQTDVYAFTNGQLQFDRNVRLGGQTNNRYVVETGDGFDSTSMRFVLNE